MRAFVRDGLKLIVMGGVFAAPLTAQSPAQTTWDGVYTKAQSDRGRGLYSQECSVCHGEQLGGVDAAPALTGGRFASNWSGVTLSDMLERIRVSMPASQPGKLSRQQTADIMSYIFNYNGFPTGERELPRQAGMLRSIVYEARNPNAGSQR